MAGQKSEQLGGLGTLRQYSSAFDINQLRPSASRALAVALSVGVFAAVVTLTAQFLKNEEEFYDAVVDVHVISPEAPPVHSQESIDLALALYSIKVPSSAEHPVFDKNLADRGLTIRAPFFQQSRVSIGPAAFASWSLLGSTLAHELEVHCQQNFMLIYIMDIIGWDGTGEAERQAYLHELRNARRFGLAGSEERLISDTVAYFYPELGHKGGIHMLTRLRKLLSAGLIQPRALDASSTPQNQNHH